MNKKYQTILADPPWGQSFCGKWKQHKMASELEYPVMNLDDIKNLPVREVAGAGCHLWLWATNQFLKQGFDVLEAWGFKYLAPITWVKPSGIGNYFIHRTQTILFGYKEKCLFPLERFKPTVLFATLPKRHSEKPTEFYSLIESISPEPRLELFARRKRFGWDCWGNEVESDIELAPIPSK
jgi:N6-adenosine-specific RNA methylase IME4